MEFSSYLWVIRKYKWIILLTTLVTAGVFAYGVQSRTPQYKATAKLRVMPFGVSATEYSEYLYFDRLVNTYIDLIHSSDIYEEVVERLDSERAPNYQFELVIGTELMALTATDEDPLVAQEVANVTAQVLIDRVSSGWATVNWATQDILLEQISALDTALNDLEGERVTVLQQTGDVPTDPEELTAMLNDRLGNENSPIDLTTLGILQGQLSEMETRLNELQAQRDKLLNDQANGRDIDEQELATLNRTIVARDRTYYSLLDSYTASLIQQATYAGSISLVSEANIPTTPVATSTALTIVMGVLVGVSGGTALSFVLEKRNSRFYTVKQMQSATKLPIIGHVPRFRTRTNNPVFTDESMEVQYFDRLRMNIFSASRADSIRKLLVTSAEPQDGKSTILANLAVSISRTGREVVLIDTDMRRPKVHKLFVLANEMGLSDVLQGDIHLQDALRESGIPRLKVLTSGQPVPNPSELVIQERMTEVMDELLEQFDIVLVDAPAAMAVADAAAVSEHCDEVLIVISQGKSEQQAVTLTVEQFENMGINLRGIIVNRAKQNDFSHLYSYYQYKSQSTNLAPIKLDD